MIFINYISIIAVPFVIFFVVCYGLSEKIKVFDTFLEGCKEGIDTVIKIFPTLIALFLAISALRSSGILDLISNILFPILSFFRIPSEIVPLILIRPISGSGATAVALDIMKNYGVDTIIRYDFFYYYGINRNNNIYNSNLYQCCWYKKNKVCTLCCSYRRCCWNAQFYCVLSNFVVDFFLTFVTLCYIIFTVIIFILELIYSSYQKILIYTSYFIATCIVI